MKCIDCIPRVLRLNFAALVSYWLKQVEMLLSLFIVFLLFLVFSDLKRKASSVKNYKAKIELLGSYDPQKQLIIRDPYYVSIQVKFYFECF